MRKLYLIFVVSAIILLINQCKTKGPLNIYLCIGQSNMAGRAKILPKDTVILQHVFLFNDRDEWEPAKNPLNRYSTVRKDISMQKLGPAWSFAKTLAQKYPKRQFGLIVNAHGGSSINEWAKGTIYYDEAIIRALKAQKTGRIMGVVWHQGESDKKHYNEYTDKFKRVVENIRRDLNISDLPVVVGEIGNWRGNSDSMNMVLDGLKEQIPNVGVVSAAGLQHRGDSTHFNNESQITLGDRYAKVMMQLIDQ